MVDGKTNSFLNGEVPVVGARESGENDSNTTEFTAPAGTANGKNFECDVLVVGAGFSGIYAIHQFRQMGLKVKCFESGSDYGGVWYWNRYPGARVDSEVPLYQLNIPEVYRTWSFSERFPDHRELRRYMAHASKTLNLRKDTEFNARVVDASWDASKNVWVVRTHQGHQATAKYLMLTTGLLHRTYTPDFPGLGDFKGQLLHSGAWKDDFTAKGKKVAIIGAGATAVQITQELGKEADELTVFLRRPSYCYPIGQRKLGEAEQRQLEMYLPALFKAARESATGFPVSQISEGALDVTPEEREAAFERLWTAGGFNFAVANFRNIGIDEQANRAAYDFWAKKVRARLTDPAKHQIMAPEEPPYYIGTKRAPLETDYYDVLNQPNVHIHNLATNPLKSFTDKGLVMADDKQYDFDAIVLATGFDSFTGSMTHMGLKNKDGVDLKELWKDGVNTYLGLTIAGFPNMFMSYSPQAPTPLSNGTTLIETQVDIAVDMIKKLESEGASSIEAEREAEISWKKAMNETFSYALMRFTDSWWNGGNIPGKKKEAMIYLGGIKAYNEECRATLDGWKGFNVVTTA